MIKRSRIASTLLSLLNLFEVCGEPLGKPTIPWSTLSPFSFHGKLFFLSDIFSPQTGQVLKPLALIYSSFAHISGKSYNLGKYRGFDTFLLSLFCVPVSFLTYLHVVTAFPCPRFYLFVLFISFVPVREKQSCACREYTSVVNSVRPVLYFPGKQYILSLSELMFYA